MNVFLYHSTTPTEANDILVSGFKDETNREAGLEFSGVRLTLNLSRKNRFTVNGLFLPRYSMEK